jgi:hypothetical protein
VYQLARRLMHGMIAIIGLLRATDIVGRRFFALSLSFATRRIAFSFRGK